MIYCLYFSVLVDVLYCVMTFTINFFKCLSLCGTDSILIASIFTDITSTPICFCIQCEAILKQ